MRKVSVVIPTFNEESVIADCLESLVEQTVEDFEVITVDDGSTDKTVGVLQTFLASSYQLKILKQDHKGPGEARNLGASKAKGVILVFVDADMTFDKDFVSDLVEPIEKGSAKGTFSKNEFVSNWDSVWARCWNINEGWEPKKRHPKSYPNEQMVFRAILKSEFDRVGGFDKGGEYNDDWSLSKKLGYKAIAVTGGEFYHKNPGTLAEIYSQAKWIGKRKYKLGSLGTLAALVRSTLPVSIFLGVTKAITSGTLKFIPFKIVYDWGVFVGILEYMLFGKKGK